MSNESEVMIEIEDIYLKSQLVDDGEQAILSVSTSIHNKGESSKPLKLYVSLIEDGEALSQPIKMDARLVIEGLVTSKLSLDLSINTPKLWSPDRPYLYQVVVEVADHYDTVLLRETLKHGFRTVCVEDQVLLLNGKEAKIKAAHLLDYEEGIDFQPDQENYLAYLKHLKESNVNAIWTGKELEDSLFYDLCDQYGFYIFEQMHCEVGQRLIKVHRNHPSIVLWAIDESGVKLADAVAYRNEMIEVDYSRPYNYKDKLLPKMTSLEQPFEFDWVQEDLTYAVRPCVDGFPVGLAELWIVKTVDGEVIEEHKVNQFNCGVADEFSGEEGMLDWEGVEDSFSHLAFEVRLSDNTWWQKQGYVMASSTYILAEPKYKDVALEHSGFCKVEDKAESLLVKGQFGIIQVNKTTGLVDQITLQGREVLASPISPNFWMSSLDRPQSVEKDFYWMVKALKNDPWEFALESMKVKTIEHKMVDELAEIVIEAKVKGLSDLLRMTYLISNQGEFTVTYEGTASKDMHRIGMLIDFSYDCEQIHYFGEGPYGHNYSSASASRCRVHHLDRSTKIQFGTEHTYKEISWLSMNDSTSTGIMFEQYSKERLRLYTENQKTIVESIEPPIKSESFIFTVKCLLLYD